MPAPKNGRRRRGWGNIRQEPSGRWRASYIHGPHLQRWEAPHTFDSQIAAEGWLAAERRQIDAEMGSPPRERAAAAIRSQVTLREYAPVAIARRSLTPKTTALYEDLLDTRILAYLGDKPLVDLTAALLRDWWATMEKTKYGRPDRRMFTPTKNAAAWQLLSSVLNNAVEDELVDANPCAQVKGAGKRPRPKDVIMLTTAELAVVHERLPEPYRLAVLVLAFCQLRFGEVIELRRSDIIDVDGDMLLRVRRAATDVNGKIVVGPPKSEAGIRNIVVPPHVADLLRAHIGTLGRGGSQRFLFTSSRGTRLCLATFTSAFKDALPAHKSEVRVHDLRHTGAVLAAQAGATTKELMARLGHTTPEMAMRYQHVAEGRDRAIAEKLSTLAGHSADGDSR